LKEKLLAALRGGIRTVLIPEDNKKDLADIPKSAIEGLRIVPVRWIDEVLDLALVEPARPRPEQVRTELQETKAQVEHSRAESDTATRAH
jgi:ATP-dependent Lon protease